MTAPSFSMSKHDVFAYFQTVVSDLSGMAYRNFNAEFFDSDGAFRRSPEKPTLKACIKAVRACFPSSGPLRWRSVSLCSFPGDPLS